jgi:hypothetical protein
MAEKLEQAIKFVNPCQKRDCDCGGIVDPFCGVHSKGCAWLASLVNVTWLPKKVIDGMRRDRVEVYRVWERGLSTPQWYTRPAVETVLRASGVWYLPGKMDPPGADFDEFLEQLLKDDRTDGLPEALDLACYTLGKYGNKTKVEAVTHWKTEVERLLAAWHGEALRHKLTYHYAASIKVLERLRMARLTVGD